MNPKISQKMPTRDSSGEVLLKGNNHPFVKPVTGELTESLPQRSSMALDGKAAVNKSQSFAQRSAINKSSTSV